MNRRLLIENFVAFSNVVPPLNFKCSISQKEQDYLRELLGGRMFDLMLLYRGSLHGFTADQFNAQCGSHQPTITLFYIVDASCIGGFTS